MHEVLHSPVMPTSRPRHTITETDAVARALDEAASRWPEEGATRARLLLRLLEKGHQAIRAEAEREVSLRREAIERTSGLLTGAYPNGYLTRLRDDWPK